MSLSQHIAALLSSPAVSLALAAYVALEGVERLNAFAVLLLRDETPQIAARFGTSEGTVRQWIGKMAKARLGARTVSEGNPGAGFEFTSLTM